MNPASVFHGIIVAVYPVLIEGHSSTAEYDSAMRSTQFTIHNLQFLDP
ncbi:MAG: hypothetical protein ABIT07_08555 [Ferruginibacter sp.]